MVKVKKAPAKPELAGVMPVEAQYLAFSKLKENDTLVVSGVLPGIDATERTYLEALEVYREEGASSARITFRATWMGLFLCNLVATLDDVAGTVEWKNSKENV